MKSSTRSILFSQLTLWTLFALVGIWYLLPHLFVANVPNRFALSRLKLGIDLKGGTYITLGVQTEKAIENKLAASFKEIEAHLKKQNYALPQEKKLEHGKLILSFADDNAAKVAYNLTKKELPYLSSSLHGTTVHIALSGAEKSRLKSQSVEQAVNVISNRLQGLGVEGISVLQHGSRQIVVQIPGVDDPERIKSLITKRAHLEFKIVEKQSSNKEELLDLYDGELPPDKMILPGESTSDIEGDEAHGQWYLVSAFPALTGDHISDARVMQVEFEKPHVGFELDREGGKIFREVTRNNINRPLAIIIDSVVLTAPHINSEIGSSGRITSGTFNFERAGDLALVLRTGAFQAPVVYEEERRVGPSLGQDSIKRGLLSCLVGLGLVIIFALFYYKIAGLFAILGLLYNLFLILLFLSYFDATLTLPGIAGMVLTIGMAIDASILIYERIKEELADGSPFRTALNVGFKGAMVVILDSNITTFLTGLILFYFGGPTIRGFAVTLMVGIVATILAGVFFLKSLFDFILKLTRAERITL